MQQKGVEGVLSEAGEPAGRARHEREQDHTELRDLNHVLCGAASPVEPVRQRHALSRQLGGRLKLGLRIEPAVGAVVVGERLKERHRHRQRHHQTETDREGSGRARHGGGQAVQGARPPGEEVGQEAERVVKREEAALAHVPVARDVRSADGEKHKEGAAQRPDGEREQAPEDERLEVPLVVVRLEGHDVGEDGARRLATEDDTVEQRLCHKDPDEGRQHERADKGGEAAGVDRLGHEVARDEAGEIDAPVGDLQEEEQRRSRALEPALVVVQDQVGRVVEVVVEIVPKDDERRAEKLGVVQVRRPAAVAAAVGRRALEPEGDEAEEAEADGDDGGAGDGEANVRRGCGGPRVLLCRVPLPQAARVGGLVRVSHRRKIRLEQEGVRVDAGGRQQLSHEGGGGRLGELVGGVRVAKGAERGLVAPADEASDVGRVGELVDGEGARLAQEDVEPQPVGAENAGRRACHLLEALAVGLEEGHGAGAVLGRVAQVAATEAGDLTAAELYVQVRVPLEGQRLQARRGEAAKRGVDLDLEAELAGLAVEAAANIGHQRLLHDHSAVLVSLPPLGVPPVLDKGLRA